MPDRHTFARPGAPGLWALGVIEAISFAGLLALVVAGSDPAALAVMGFVHGCVYLADLAVAWWLVDDERARGLAVIPGLGALLMARALNRPRAGSRPGSGR